MPTPRATSDTQLLCGRPPSAAGNTGSTRRFTTVMARTSSASRDRKAPIDWVTARAKYEDVMLRAIRQRDESHGYGDEAILGDSADDIVNDVFLQLRISGNGPSNPNRLEVVPLQCCGERHHNTPSAVPATTNHSPTNHDSPTPTLQPPHFSPPNAKQDASPATPISAMALASGVMHRQEEESNTEGLRVFASAPLLGGRRYRSPQAMTRPRGDDSKFHGPERSAGSVADTELVALDVVATVLTIPPKSRALVTAHFADGIPVLGVDFIVRGWVRHCGRVGDPGPYPIQASRR